jgi:hypothetical protein
VVPTEDAGFRAEPFIQSPITRFAATTLPWVCLQDSVFWIGATPPTLWTSFAAN